jgi:predicted dehydrogenase
MSYKVGIIGTSFGASYHLPAYQNHPKFDVIGISGKNYIKTTKIAQEHKIKAYDSWAFLVEDKEIDIVSIATPPKLHFEIAKAALNNNKHILLEKPTTSNSDQAKVLYELTRSNRLIGMMAHEWRYYYPNQILFKMLNDDKLIGDLEELRIQDLLSYAYNDNYSWEYDKLQDGGWVGIAGSHIVDLVRFLTKLEFKEIYGHTHIRQKFLKDIEGNDRKVTAEDAFSSIFRLTNGAHGIIDHLPTLKPAPASRMILSGSKGTIYTEGANILISERIYYSENEGKFTAVNLDNNPHNIGDLGIGGVMHKLFQILLDEFSNSIETTTDPSLSIYDGWRNQEILDKIKVH